MTNVDRMNDSLGGVLGKISFFPERVKTDSRDVMPGDLFVAVAGTSSDGHSYIPEVIKRGAGAVVCERAPEDLLPGDRAKCVVVPDSKKALANIAKIVYADPTSKMRIFGVTGTSGKTTNAFFIRDILNNSGAECGLVSTVFTMTGKDNCEKANMTTPDVMTLNRLFADMLMRGVRTAAIEVSSHALSQDRAYGIGLDAAIFTNISPEHMDYHKTMEKYLADKMRIFELLKPDGVAVVNVDDPLVAKMLPKIKARKIIRFGVKNSADLKAENIRSSSSGTEFDMVSDLMGKIHVKTGYIGLYNVYNMLSSAAALLHCGINPRNIQKTFESSGQVPGRLEAVESNAPFRVFVDYAHKPNALENVLRCLNHIKTARVICVFGCGGDRDRTKRPVMGKIAADMSDYVFVTSDNPRNEAPMEIIKEIEAGLVGRANYKVVPDREAAISEAIAMAEKDDIVVIAGKGHEDYQIIGSEKVHFDDREVARKVLNKNGF